jgi:phosphate transport system substrate-binding protein
MLRARFATIVGVSFGLLFASDVDAQPTQRIVIDGSTGVMPLTSALAKAFQEHNPGTTLEIGTGLGTKARMQALDEGKIDIALASHGLDAGEIRRRGMSVHEVARTAVVFGVNSGVSIANLTEQQVCDIYSGAMANWKLLSGPDLQIAARARPDSEVDAEVVRAGIHCLKNLRFPESVKIMPRSGDMAKELAATAGAIGMTTLTVTEQSAGKIRAISINGIAPNSSNVEKKTYPLLRESFFLTRSSPSPQVARFLHFARSPDGDKVIRANGAIPVQ